MARLLASLGLMLILLAVVGCSSAPAPASVQRDGGTAPAARPPVTFTAAPATTSASAAGNYANSPNFPFNDRMVVRTGNLDLVVSDVSISLDNIARLAADFGGYVVTSQKFKQGERIAGSISIRVLAENYEKAIISLRALAMVVITETSSSQDVTQEYTDLSSQVKNLEATESQLLKIMASATKTEDVLAVQRELTTVRGQIEQNKGRMQYLERTSATSLIQINLKEAEINVQFNADKVNVNTDQSVLFTSDVSGGFLPYSYVWDFGDGSQGTDRSPIHAYKSAGIYTVVLNVTDDRGYTNSITRTAYINVVESWNPINVAKGAWHGFTAFGKVLIGIVIWLAIFSPVWIIAGGIVIWRVSRARRRK